MFWAYYLSQEVVGIAMLLFVSIGVVSERSGLSSALANEISGCMFFIAFLLWTDPRFITNDSALFFEVFSMELLIEQFKELASLFGE